MRQLHTATASFRAPADALWYAWFGRSLGNGERTVGHCDVAPWDRAGPVDPLVELAQACWLNAKLHDDIVAEREGFPPVDERARQLRAIVDAYGLSASQRGGFVDCIVEFTIHNAANEADLAHITGATTPDQLDPRVPRALAWRARASAWQLRNRRILERALT